MFAAPDRFRWVDFLDFLRTYDLAASVIRTAQDYRDITYEYLMGCAREGAIYVELIASPDHAASVGLTDAEHYGGIAAGIDDARRDSGIEARILVAAIRNFGVEAAVDDRAPRTPTTAIPTSSASTSRATRRATRRRSSPRRTRSPPASGLGCTVHAGEHDGAESVREALTLPVTPHLARRARDRGPGAGARRSPSAGSCSRPVPTSNVATKVFACYEAHPLRDASRSRCEAHVGF